MRLSMSGAVALEITKLSWKVELTSQDSPIEYLMIQSGLILRILDSGDRANYVTFSNNPDRMTLRINYS